MKNYKIHVTPETSAEVQELFFALGFEWKVFKKSILNHALPMMYTNSGYLYTRFIDGNEISENQEITLPQLRDLVVLKRNDLSDANYVQKNAKRNKFYVGHDCYYWNNDSWKKSTLGENSIKINLIPINKLNACFSWQDALRAVADGKEIQVWGIDDWVNTNQHYEWSLYHFSQRKFRIKPQTVTLEARPYTKEDLLKIVGEME